MSHLPSRKLVSHVVLFRFQGTESYSALNEFLVILLAHDAFAQIEYYVNTLSSFFQLDLY